LNAPSRNAIRLAVSMGDPAGVGPELCVKAAAGGRLPADTALTIIGARRLLGAIAADVLDLDNVPPDTPLPRRPTAAGGRASLDYIEAAVRSVLEGRADALVTCPISKEAIAAAGSPYPGHTEMLAELAGGGRPVMLLVNGPLRVAFATTHAPLRDVPGMLTAEGIAHTGVTLGRALREHFDIPAPRLAVCALNPHAGDGGRFGDEEARLLAPAVAAIRRAGIEASGPLPSDTLFARALKGDFDGVVALYHDQGMIPVKLAGLGGVVNVTLGLRIIRTSPGHGTAYDIAGKGIADESSLLSAIAMATAMVRSSRGLRAPRADRIK